MTTLDRRYEKFQGGPAMSPAGAREPRVTINRKGLIYMNDCAYNKLGRPKFVSLYYSREDDSIAVEPVFPPDPASFPVTKKQMGWAVHGSTFCRHYRIRVPITTRFLAPTIENGILVLALRQTVTVGGINRGKRVSA
ncbi:MAG: hypothetical protein IPM59_12965 [Chloracidobacterium sp.]|nr:hypothetical protein [Chloracidobacterium sp.]